ncbi:hypothetical protein Mapa_000768 [Marchantia paleacea]|nr:hypothetical protein Mapa_000768 [Marchantia paleacea]
MNQRSLIVVYLTALMAAVSLSKLEASDPDLVSDFFVPEGVNISTIDGNYFTFTGFRSGVPMESGKKFGISKATLATFPALTGLGVSYALLSYLPGGLNALHTHPRASEILYLISGTLEVGVIDSTNKLYSQTLSAGDLFVFPKGLVHYQINTDAKTTALAISGLSSAMPGVVSLGTNIFGSGISEGVLSKSFDVSTDVIKTLESAFATKSK